MNIINFVPNDHIMGANEIIQTQSIAIQTYMLENEHLQKELKEVYDKLTNKEQQITQLTNNWNELEDAIDNEVNYYIEDEDAEWFEAKKIQNIMKEISGGK